MAQEAEFKQAVVDEKIDMLFEDVPEEESGRKLAAGSDDGAREITTTTTTTNFGSPVGRHVAQRQTRGPGDAQGHS